MGLKAALKKIDQYAVTHTKPLPPLVQELVDETYKEMGRMAGMLSGPVEGSLLQMLVATVGAKRVLEIGMFTGYSALMMAAALPDDGEMVTLELSAEHAAFARGFFERSEDGRKVRLMEGPALESLKSLQGPFDLVFIDANKGGYVDYYEAALPMLSEHGLIAVDNVLWSGNVLDPKDDDAKAIVAFNDHVSRDTRVTHVMLTVRDGIMLIRRR